ncbi:MAG: hypothetical protein KDA57_09955 [Planctomycetales bacterium]|nr:hypothetical protein [Planctomycetales bacterium]
MGVPSCWQPRALMIGCCVLILAANELAAESLPLLVSEDFSAGMQRWQTTDPDASKPFWKVIDLEIEGKTNRVLRVTGKSNYEPPYRSPHSIALLKDIKVGDFELTVKLQSTDQISGNHRDLCLFWGYQDPANFYYVHFGAKADPHACQIFIVDDAARTMITTVEASGTPWTDGWHQAKVVRNVANGNIDVYFDDMDKPLMSACDKTFTWGQIGLGTFDNHGNFDDLHLFGIEANK